MKRRQCFGLKGLEVEYSRSRRQLVHAVTMSTVALVVCMVTGCGDYKPPKFSEIVDSVQGKDEKPEEKKPAAQPATQTGIAPGSVPANSAKSAAQPAAPAQIEAAVSTKSPDQIMKELEEKEFKLKTDLELRLLLEGLGDHADLVTKLSLEEAFTNITAAGMQLLPSFPKLVDLNLANLSLPSAGYEPLEKCEQLERLSFYNNQSIDDDGLAHIRPLVHLKELNLQRTRQVTDEGHHNLETLRELEKLDISSNPKIRGAGFVSCRKKNSLGSLRELIANGTLFGEQGIEGIMGLASLEVLEIGNTHLSNQGMAPMRKCNAGLKKLVIGTNQAITDAGMMELKRFKQLEYLSLRNLPLVTNEGLSYVKGAKKLEFVDVDGTRINDDGVYGLKKLIKNVKIKYNGKEI